MDQSTELRSDGDGTLDPAAYAEECLDGIQKSLLAVRANDPAASRTPSASGTSSRANASSASGGSPRRTADATGAFSLPFVPSVGLFHPEVPFT